VSGRLLRALTALAALVGCVAAVCPGAAATARRGAQLTVIASRTHKSFPEILVFGPRGQALPAIGAPPDIGRARHLAWSPDGREYAYIDPGIDLPELMVAKAGSSDPRRVAGPSYGDEPVIDPEGDVVYSRIETVLPSPGPVYGPPVPSGTTLWATPTDGSERRRLASFGPQLDIHPYSSASDGTLAFTASDPRGNGIAILSPGKKALRWIVGPGKGEYLSPAISPDGSQVVYLRDRTERRFPHGLRLVSTKLISVPTSGGRTKVLATIVGGARWPSWDPSGSRIAFTALATRNRGGDFSPGPHSALMEINADGSCPTTVYTAKDGGWVLGGAWRLGKGRGTRPISC
jgi:Tol biopolymer transport system component